PSHQTVSPFARRRAERTPFSPPPRPRPGRPCASLAPARVRPCQGCFSSRFDLPPFGGSCRGGGFSLLPGRRLLRRLDFLGIRRRESCRGGGFPLLPGRRGFRPLGIRLLSPAPFLP